VQTNFLEFPEEIPVLPGAEPELPAANQTPAVPALPPVIHYPIPLALADYSEPRVVAMVADEGVPEPMEQRLDAPVLPPVVEEDAAPSSAPTGLALALLGFPCAVAAERQRREFYRDRQREKWPWVW
jgi:hypothetical protein